MSEHGGFWVFSENYDLMLELLSGAAQVASAKNTELVAVLLGPTLSEKAEDAIRYGAKKVIIADNPQLKDYNNETYLDALSKLTSKFKPETFLIGASKNGKELASRLAGRLGTGCVPDCNFIGLDDNGNLLTKRIVYSGSAVVTAAFIKKPEIATVPPRIFEKAEPKEREGEILKVQIQVPEPKVMVDNIDEIEVSGVKIEEAKMVVCGGRGLEKKEDFKPLEELASILDGQVGNTRPLAEDRKWFSGWVGLSGKKIKPTLYIGCGISGMIQHVAGMRDSQVVVAINKDPEAAIFEVADYVLVGDLYEIVPVLVEELKKVLKSG